MPAGWCFIAVVLALVLVLAVLCAKAQAPPNPTHQGQALAYLAAALRTPSMAAQHPEACGVLEHWTIVPGPTRAVPAERRIQVQMTDGQAMFDAETLKRVLLHEVAHALEGAGHGPELLAREAALCSAAERDGALDPHGSVSDSYPAEILAS